MSQNIFRLKEVYPRVYGGTGVRVDQERSNTGLSPRVRGNQSQTGEAGALIGSIPACTGEPYRPAGRKRQRRVYPRVYGGTSGRNRTRQPSAGLSPRVRGNPRQVGRVAPDPGSIPACTGEPRSKTARHRSSPVYPRVYGEPYEKCRDMNLSAVYPACTGEPSNAARYLKEYQVYPRVYGGTGPISPLGET